MIEAKFDVRVILLAIVDRILRDILAWLERYRDVVLHPEAWQGKEVELNLTLTVSEEIAALHRLLEHEEIDMDHIMIEEFDCQIMPQRSGSIYHQPTPQQSGVGAPGLLIAFAVGIGFGDDD